MHSNETVYKQHTAPNKVNSAFIVEEGERKKNYINNLTISFRNALIFTKTHSPLSITMLATFQAVHIHTDHPHTYRHNHRRVE